MRDPIYSAQAEERDIGDRHVWLKARTADARDAGATNVRATHETINGAAMILLEGFDYLGPQPFPHFALTPTKTDGVVQS